MSRYLRYLRIAFSASCGIACVLLVVLWVRSYWKVEHIFWNGEAKYFGISIYPGEVTLESGERIFMPLGWSRVVFPIHDDDATLEDEPSTVLGFGWEAEDKLKTAYIPFWFFTLPSLAFAILPYAAVKRFSLRTLLITTTLVAVLLGAIVRSVRG